MGKLWVSQQARQNSLSPQAAIWSRNRAHTCTQTTLVSPWSTKTKHMDHNNTLQAPSAHTVQECTFTAIWNVRQGNTSPSLCNTSQGFITTYMHLLMSSLLVIADCAGMCPFFPVWPHNSPRREVCRLSSVTSQGANSFRQLKPCRLSKASCLQDQTTLSCSALPKPDSSREHIWKAVTLTSHFVSLILS